MGYILLNILIVVTLAGINSPNEDGYSRLVDNKPVIYYNDNKPTRRIRFTIAHEIGHILLGHLSQGETLHRIQRMMCLTQENNKLMYLQEIY